MAKQKIVLNKVHHLKRNNTFKMRIGTRKTGRSGMLMSEFQLMEALTSPSTRPRDLKKIKTCLLQKGVTII